MEKDRFLFGCFSGIAGGIIALVTMGIPAKLLGLTDKLVYDYGMIIILGKPKYEFLDYVVGLLAHLSVSGISGTLFAFFIYLTSPRCLFIKGFFFGVGIWFFLSSIGTLYKVPMIMEKTAQGALVTFVTSGYWGLITPLFLKIFHAKLTVKNNAPEKTKIHKYRVLPIPAQKKEPKRIKPDKGVVFKKPKKPRKL